MRWIKALPALLSRRWRRLAVTAAGAAILLLAALLDRPTLTAWLALAAALPALVMAYVALFKAKTLEFCPEILGGDVILPRPRAIGDRPRLLLPLQFSNRGYADGIVEWLALRLTPDGRSERSLLLSPVAEVDMQRFIQAKRKLDDTAIEPFTAFPLEGRRSLAKFVLFDLAEKARSAPLSLRPGRYTFELFVKSTANRSPKLERVFEHAVEPKHAEEFAADAPIYLINYQMTLPGARREMTGAEWMPRATRYS
ncbi:MAG TPA: hypothetical protein VFS85_01255 [Dongiaceae bacterium]|nr:hypothetical protein [Dongiaceae bacterium]